MLSLEECLAYFSHQFIFFLGSGVDELLFFWEGIAVNFGDGKLETVLLILAEGIAFSGFQPFCDHFDVLKGCHLVVCFIDFYSNLCGTFFVLALTEDVELRAMFRCKQFCYDIIHRDSLSFLVFVLIVAEEAGL